MRTQITAPYSLVWTAVLALMTSFANITMSLAGGMHSGGGSGVATYRPGAPKTLENIVKVESLVMYRARRNGTLTISENHLLNNKSTVLSLEEKIEALNANQAVKKMIEQASPEFYLFYAQADQKFQKALTQAENLYRQSKTLTPDGKAVAIELNLINDFGRPESLAENESYVQIIMRTGSGFEINMALWSMLQSLDRLDLEIHEAAYAVSWQKDSTKIQKLQLFMIQKYLQPRPDKDFAQEFRARAKSDWGLVQVNSNAEHLAIPEIQVVDRRPYRDSGYRADADYPPGLPLESDDGLQCAWVAELIPNGDSANVKILYWNGREGIKKTVSLSEREWSIFSRFKSAAHTAILAQIDPFKSALTFDYPTVLCFKKTLGFLGNVKYIEFRKAYDFKKAKELGDESNNDQYESALFAALDTYVETLFKGINDKLNQQQYVVAIESAVRAGLEKVNSVEMNNNLSTLSHKLKVLRKASFLLRIRLNSISSSEPGYDEFQSKLLRYSGEVHYLEMREEGEFLRQRPIVLRPPSTTYYRGAPGQLGIFSEHAKPHEILGRLGANILD